MLGKEFRGSMTKHTYACKDNVAFVQVEIKHINANEVQTFLDKFQTILGITNVSSLFMHPVQWNKLEIPTFDYDKNYVKVEFDEIEFTGYLLNIKVVKKWVDDTETFEYTFVFSKEVSKDDAMIATTYLKRKDENEEGKKVVTEFPTIISLIDKPTEYESVSDEIL
jgi:hypothetical protein